MRTIGYLISHKAQEKRRAILPEDLMNISNSSHVYIEEGYGSSLRIADDEYKKYGAHIVNRSEVVNCDILVDPKLGSADYLDELEDGKILIGWAHALQQVDFTSGCIEHKHTVIAWEDIYQNGRYIFYRNREIAGEAGIMQALLYLGKMPYEASVAVLGNGQTAKGVMRILNGLGAKVDVYNRKLEELFKEKMYDYDVIVNCILWDTSREDHIIYKEDLKKFRPGTMIVDISCDPGMEIETARPTTIENPVYEIDGVIHYEVDNTPAMFPITVSEIISKEFSVYVDGILEGVYPKEIEEAIEIKDGEILKEDIISYRRRLGL